MAHLHLRPGVRPDEPDEPVVTLVVDPGGPPGEGAVARLGGCGVEGEGAFFLPATDGWAEHTLEDEDRLVVDVAVYPSALERTGSDPAAFPARSAFDPEAALVLRAELTVDPELYARTAPVTAVFTAGPERPVGEVLADGDTWPVLLAIRPER